MFLSSAKVRGRDTTIELRTKQAILTACTYSGSGNKIVHCPSSLANFVGNKEERLETLQKFMSFLYPRKSKTKSLITLLLDTITKSKKEQVLMLCQTLETLAVVEKDSVNDAIVNHVRCFLSSAKVRGRVTSSKYRLFRAQF